MIWIDEVHPLSGRAAIVVDDGRSCWLYLHERANGPVLKSVLCYSPIPPITKAEFDSVVCCGDTPILISDYASPDAVIVERFADDFSNFGFSREYVLEWRHSCHLSTTRSSAACCVREFY